MGIPRIYGIDFTSAPGERKPIVCAGCELRGRRLHVRTLEHWSNLSQFEAWLRRPGPWVAGLDFPFGVPAEFVSALAAPGHWEGYVARFAALGRNGFRAAVEAFKADRPPGRKDLKRETDRRASAASPLNVTRPPVGLMFLEGAPRLLASPVSVLPCRPRPAAVRTVVECYPALAARALIGRRPYKGGGPAGAAQRAGARAELLAALSGGGAARHYGLQLALAGRRWAGELVADAEGDGLDALMCALQAGWGFRCVGGRFGIPTSCHRAEGWIVDPATAGRSARRARYRRVSSTALYSWTAAR